VDIVVLAIGGFILIIIFGGFFAFRFIRNQLYELKLDLLNTIRDRQKLEKHTIKEGTRMFSINTARLNENELKLLIVKANSIIGLHEVKNDQHVLTLTVAMLKKRQIQEELERFKRDSDMDFFFI
jgi:hypothetical protein